MKGFPNQVASLGKIAKGLRVLVGLIDSGNPTNDDSYGEALVRAGVAGTGHSPRPVEEYLQEQRTKRRQDQSFQATARGLKELYSLFGFIEYSGDSVVVLSLGRQAAALPEGALDQARIGFWRRVIRGMEHFGKDSEASHPYQVLLRLVAKKPGIRKPLCALAFEALNDSDEELNRIVALSDLPEIEILKTIRVTQRNWDNAVKVLPKLAEQLKDVEILGSMKARAYRIADAPGMAEGSGEVLESDRLSRPGVPRAPRSSRSVTPETIGNAGMGELANEPEVRPVADPVVTARLRLERLRRHNALVRSLAGRLTGMELFEDPFDILAIANGVGIMVEVKSLDGTVEDETARVREALSQLLYYAAFLVNPTVREESIQKIALFEKRLTEAHAKWLNQHNIAVLWQEGEKFAGDDLAIGFLGKFLKELQ